MRRGITGPLGDHLPTTSGARRWREAAVRDQDDDRAAAQYALAVERLGAAGYRGYEISNWGRPGHESRHNLVYWQRRSVRGGRAGRPRVRRRASGAGTRPGWTGTCGRSSPADGAQPALPPGGSDEVDGDAAAAEAVILALRLDTGLAAAEARGGPLAPHLDWALDAGLLEPFDADGGPASGSRRAAACCPTSCSRGSSSDTVCRVATLVIDGRGPRRPASET